MSSKKRNTSCKKHGKCNTRLYVIWHSMRGRCHYPSTNQYKNYGGRGIKVCNEWETNFMNFYNWAINNGYEDNLTLDRIDVDGNYEPDNCQWVDMKTQNNKRRSNKYIEYNGEIKTQIQWCEKFNINPTTFLDRLKRGWTIEQALTIPTKGFQRKVK